MLLEDKTILENIKKTYKESFVVSLLLIVFAIVLLINPENFMNTAINVFGYVAIFMGVLNLVFYFRIPDSQKIFSKNFQNGLLLCLSGVIAFLETNTIKEIVTLLIGGYIIFRNVIRAGLSLNIKSYTTKMWLYLLVVSFINIVLGFLIIINPFTNILKTNQFIATMIIISEVFIIIENIAVLIGLRTNEKTKE